MATYAFSQPDDRRLPAALACALSAKRSEYALGRVLRQLDRRLARLLRDRGRHEVLVRAGLGREPPSPAVARLRARVVARSFAHARDPRHLDWLDLVVCGDRSEWEDRPGGRECRVRVGADDLADLVHEVSVRTGVKGESPRLTCLRRSYALCAFLCSSRDCSAARSRCSLGIR